MIQEICRDIQILSTVSEMATKEDLSTAVDLLDTLRANKEVCVGVAANMIGVTKRIICFDNEGVYMVMFNPELVKCSEPFSAKEGCLSLTYSSEVKRWKHIKVRYQSQTPTA